MYVPSLCFAHQVEWTAENTYLNMILHRNIPILFDKKIGYSVLSIPIVFTNVFLTSYASKIN